VKNILVATPCFDTVHTDYCSSIIQNMMYLVIKRYNCSISYHPSKNTYLHTSRALVIEHARSINATHIIWVDSDMKFPEYSFLKLLEHNLDFVGVNYSTRISPHRFTAAKLNNPEQNEYMFFPVATNDKSSGLEKVDGIGFGLCLTKVDLFDKIQKPYFRHEYVESRQGYRGEDYQFCIDISPFTEIYIDHDLSREVKHIGNIEYNYLCPGV